MDTLQGLDKKTMILELFSRCTHQEQLELIEELSLYLKRDFIKLLPIEVVEKVLSYLPVSSVASCVRTLTSSTGHQHTGESAASAIHSVLQVSKSWCSVITSCDGYWKKQCVRSGLVGKILSKEKTSLGGYKNVVCRLLQLECHLRRGWSVEYFQFQDDSSEIQDSLIVLTPVCNGFCIRIEGTVNPTLTLLRRQQCVISEVAQVSNVFPNGFFAIQWCMSTPNCALLLGNNGVWVEFLFSGDTPNAPPTVTQWQDEVEMSSNRFFSRCRKCHMVAAMPAEMNKQNFWSFHFSELLKHPAVVQHCKVAKRFLPDVVAKDHRLFFARKIHIYPRDCDVSCSNHWMLVQFGSVVVQFEITKKGKLVEISEPVKILMPNGEPSLYTDQDLLGKFAISHDETLVAIMIRNDDGSICSHIWNLALGLNPLVVTNFASKEFIAKVECAAIGHLYQLMLVVSDGRVYVQRLQGDRYCHKVCVLDQFKDVRDGHACGNQDWMNSLSEWPTHGLVCLFTPIKFRNLDNIPSGDSGCCMIYAVHAN